LQFRSIDTGPFDALGACVQPIRLLHGPRFQVLGFRVGDIAYCTDVKEIPPESWRYLEGLKHLILGALRFRPHPTHMNLEEALATCDRVRPKQTWLTHLSHEFGHEETEKLLPGHVRLAYDGLRLPLV
jgi:phosphoribosyl 1,2-cyclic phosphate phosphodiesterase